MRYAIWFNGNNWESRAFMEIVDAALFIDIEFLDGARVGSYTWFIVDQIGRDILIDKGVVSL